MLTLLDKVAVAGLAAVVYRWFPRQRGRAFRRTFTRHLCWFAWLRCIHRTQSKTLAFVNELGEYIGIYELLHSMPEWLTNAESKTLIVFSAPTALFIRHGKHPALRHDTIRYDTVYLTCSKQLTCSQLSEPHGTNKKLNKNRTKNKSRSMVSRSDLVR